MTITVRPDRADFLVSIAVDVASHVAAVQLLQRAVGRLGELLPPETTLTPTHFGPDGESIFTHATETQDPERALNLMLLDMQGHMEEAKKHTAIAIADEKRLQRLAEMERSLVVEWEKKADLAVRADSHELAKQALTRAREHERMAVEYDQKWDVQKRAVEQVKTALQCLNQQIAEAKRERNLLIARSKRAEAQKTIGEALIALEPSSYNETLARMEEKVAAAEAEAEAITATQQARLTLAAPPTSRAVENANRPQPESAGPDKKALAEPPAPQPGSESAPKPQRTAATVGKAAMQETRSLVHARLHVPLDLDSSFWDRAQKIAALEDALRTFALEVKQQNPALDVTISAPVFSVRDPEAHRPTLVARSRRGGRDLASSPQTVQQRSLGLDEVELSLGANAGRMC